MPDYTFDDCMEILKDMNYTNPQYMIMLDTSCIILYDKKFSLIVFQCNNPKRMFHHFCHQCKKIHNDILKCFRHVSNIYYDRHTSPLESIWPYKNLLKYYTPEQIKSMLYEE